jgi:hypothetical protein
MSYEVKWHTPDAIILVRLWGNLDISEFPKFDRLILEHIEQSDRVLVHIWVDLKAVTEFPVKIWQVQQALTHLNHERTGWSVIITDNRIIKFVGSVITQVAKARFRAFGSDAEALQFLLLVDSTLGANTT